MDKFKESSICIVGMIRDSDHTLPALLNQLDNFSCLFKQSAVLIYESNSEDNTPKILNQWERNTNENNSLCSKFINTTSHHNEPFIMKKLLKPNRDPGDEYHFLSRLDKYSAYRNYLLNESIALNMNFDYYAPIDLDVYALDIKRILNALHKAKEKDVSVMCVNGIGRTGYMRDALATIAVNPNNHSDRIWFYYMKGVKPSNMIYANEEFSDVVSCFGAMAFYNFADVIHSKCKYMKTSDAINAYPSLARYYYINEKKGDVGICEHITFNYCLYQYNLKLVIAKDAYLYYGWNALPKQFRRVFTTEVSQYSVVEQQSALFNVSFLHREVMNLYNDTEKMRKLEQREQLQRYGDSKYNQEEKTINPGKIQKLNLTVRMLQATFVLLSVFGFVLWCWHKRLRSIKIKVNIFGTQHEIFGCS